MDWTPSSDPAVRRRFRLAVVAAYVAFGVNLLASVGAAIFLEPGSTAHPLDERAKYVTSHLRDWQWTWMIWMIAAPSLALFYAAFARTLSDELAMVSWMAVAIAALGVVFDIVAEIMLAFQLPKEYAQLPPGMSERALLFDERAKAALRIEGRAVLLTGMLANGLYTLAGMMLAFVACQTPGFPRWVALASIPAWAAGLALSAACFLQMPRVIAVSMAATLSLFLLWLGLLMFFLWRRAAGRVDMPSKPG